MSDGQVYRLLFDPKLAPIQPERARPQSKIVAFARNVLVTYEAFAVGAAFGHYLVFPLIWPLLPLFDVDSAQPSLAILQYLKEFAALHVAVMLVGGLSVQIPALVAIARRRRVRA